VASRDIEGATDALNPVLELPPSQRISGIINSVQRVHQAISRAAWPTTPETWSSALRTPTNRKVGTLSKSGQDGWRWSAPETTVRRVSY
jgi:hypothetical protein